MQGLTSITDAQAVSLGSVSGILVLSGLTSITDIQAESLGKVKQLELDGVTSISEKQAEHLGKVRILGISKDLKPLIDKYKKQ